MELIREQEVGKTSKRHKLDISSVLLLSDQIRQRALSVPSKYDDQFDYSIYDLLAKKFEKETMPWGVVYKTVFRLANYHPSCTKCHYAFEIDTYGRGCVFNCGYCYAKDQLTKHGAWNKPHPFPIDIGEVRRLFALVFETDRRSRFRSILESRIPLRIGSMSDSFMWIDRKYKVTQELLKILRFYKYPYIIFTRSDLVAHEDYLALLDQSLSSIQFSITGLNSELTRKLEPGAPSVEKRFSALNVLAKEGFRTAVRLNPLFPTYPDGYFSNRKRLLERLGTGEIPSFPLFNIGEAEGFVSRLAESGVKTLVAGYVRLSRFSLSQIREMTGADLSSFFDSSLPENLGDNKHYSDSEVAYYYKVLQSECAKQNIRFTTCYIGNGIKDYFQYQDLWANKKDCCDVVGNIKAFEKTSQEVSWDVRTPFAKHRSIADEGRRLDEQFLN